MDFNIICLDTENPNLIFDVSLAPDLLLYSYIPVSITALIFGFFVYIKKRGDFNLHNKIFFALTVLFFLHIINEILQWTSVPAALMYFGWSLVPLFHSLLSVTLLYFTYVYINKKDIATKTKLIYLLLLFPVIIFLPTNLNIVGFDIFECNAINGNIWTYVILLKILTALSFLLLAFRSLKNIKIYDTILSLGALMFFTIFFGSEQIGYFTYNFEFNLIGPLGMLFFIAILAYLVVKTNAFSIKLIAPHAIILSLVFLIFSLFFNANSKSEYLILSANLILVVILGNLLVKSVKLEIEAKNKLKLTTIDLESANERLRVLDKQKSEFVSIASHQLRSPLTAIRGYVSMIKEGSFGEVPDKMKEALNRIDESGHFMASSIDDFLNVSRIESGNMKYDYSNIDIVDMSKNVVEDLQADATNRGLLLLYRTNITEPNITSYADGGKVQQILHNLINNSLKYTKKGTVTVYVHNNIDTKKLMVEIIDTGIGMSEETLSKIFGKFSRAKIASSANIMGTGLGLFVAREMARAMKGDITAHSEGEGKGSRFIFTIPYDTGQGAIEVRS